MDRKLVVWVSISALFVLFSLFEVDFNVEFAPSGEKRVPDPEQAARYTACYEARDNEIHATAFDTIDNPDVQKLYIANNRAQAAAECRLKFPEKWIMVAEPMHFNLIDLRFRFQ